MADQRIRSAQQAIQTLTTHGVRYVFGVPGAKIDAVYDALADGGPQLVVCRHEQNAALMAAAVGRLSSVARLGPPWSRPGRGPRTC
ncbi:thiamine pyrophosphate-binding protein [Streptomyces sp900116325]|uniref:Thiamine pyrophosphate-binding protein n=1 Tax=Streptomyces sp. 900116325 TaxID=3154295 RepID=A0ABV2UJC1_9ACTN